MMMPMLMLKRGGGYHLFIDRLQIITTVYGVKNSHSRLPACTLPTTLHTLLAGGVLSALYALGESVGSVGALPGLPGLAWFSGV